MNNSDSSLRLTLGPLRYRLVAHDAWGREELSRLRSNLDCVAFTGSPDRILHLLEFQLTAQEHRQINSDYLPDRLADILPGNLPRQGWKLTGDETGHLNWWHDRAPHALWTFKTIPADCRAPFQLPWLPILEDMVNAGGGIFHGGLAVLRNWGVLFTAPPGGGKTTTLSRLAAPWQVMADDAALVWPVAGDGIRASPLPTWSVLLGRTEAISVIDRWQVGAAVEVARIIFLKKAHQPRLSPLRPIEAAWHLYRAFSEHPRVVSNRDPFRQALFHTACLLARAVPAWELQLNRAGDFSSLLHDAIADV